MYLKLFVMAIGISIMLMSCQTKTEQNSDENLDPNIHKVVVEEVKQTKTYTYLKVMEKDSEYWIAISKREIKEDDILYYLRSLEMKDFESKDLNQTFETIHFVDEITDKPITKSEKGLTVSPGSRKQIIQKDGISINPDNGEITIAELYSKKDKYSDKEIKIKGQVVKFNSQIMGKNWVHLQDGTKHENNYDLTITTDEKVKVGDVITFEGKIRLNEDFGAGYSYEVMMKNARQVAIK